MAPLRGLQYPPGVSPTSHSPQTAITGVPALRLRALGNAGVDRADGFTHGAGAQRKPLALLALLARAGPRASPETRYSRSSGPRPTPNAAAPWPHPVALLASPRSPVRGSVQSPRVASFVSTPTRSPLMSPSSSNALERRDLEAAVSVFGGPFLDGFFMGGSVEGSTNGWSGSGRSSTGSIGRRWRRSPRALRRTAGCRRRCGGGDRSCRPTLSTPGLRPGCLDALSAAGDRAGALRGCMRLHEERVRQRAGCGRDPAVLAAYERIVTARPRSGPRRLPCCRSSILSPEPGERILQ